MKMLLKSLILLTRAREHFVEVAILARRAADMEAVSLALFAPQALTFHFSSPKSINRTLFAVTILSRSLPNTHLAAADLRLPYARYFTKALLLELIHVPALCCGMLAVT